MGLKIFDAHLHIGRWDGIFLEGRKIEPLRNQTIESSESLLKFFNKYGVDCGVIVPIYSPKREEAFLLNQLVLQIAREIPNQVVPGFWVDPSPSMQSHLENALQLAETHNVTVLKTSPETWDSDYSPNPDTWDSSFRRCMHSIFDYAIEKKAIIQIHTGSGKSDVRLIDKLIHYAGKNICFHLVHLGNTINGHFYLLSNLSQWVRNGYHIIADTALARGFAIRWLCDLAHQDPVMQTSVMFASDEPWGSFPSELAKIIDATEKNPQLRTSLIWLNAKHFYLDHNTLL